MLSLHLHTTHVAHFSWVVWTTTFPSAQNLFSKISHQSDSPKKISKSKPVTRNESWMIFSERAIWSLRRNSSRGINFSFSLSIHVVLNRKHAEYSHQKNDSITFSFLYSFFWTTSWKIRTKSKSHNISIILKRSRNDKNTSLTLPASPTYFQHFTEILFPESHF